MAFHSTRNRLFICLNQLFVCYFAGDYFEIKAEMEGKHYDEQNLDVKSPMSTTSGGSAYTDNNSMATFYMNDVNPNNGSMIPQYPNEQATSQV